MCLAVGQRPGDLGGGDEDQDGQRDDDDADGPELAGQVGLGPLLDRLGDLDHRRGALVGGQHAAHQDRTPVPMATRPHAAAKISHTHSVLCRWNAW